MLCDRALLSIHSIVFHSGSTVRVSTGDAETGLCNVTRDIELAQWCAAA
jgi:hypothetical protein